MKSSKNENGGKLDDIQTMYRKFLWAKERNKTISEVKMRGYITEHLQVPLDHRLSESINRKALLVNFLSVFKEFSVPRLDVLLRFSILSLLFLRLTSVFLFFSNLLCREHALRILNFALISFLLFSPHFLCKQIYNFTYPWTNVNWFLQVKAFRY